MYDVRIRTHTCESQGKTYGVHFGDIALFFPLDGVQDVCKRVLESQ